MDLTLTFTGVKCELCSFVWLISFRRNEKSEKLECPNCKQMVEYDLVSLDNFKSKTDEPG